MATAGAAVIRRRQSVRRQALLALAVLVLGLAGWMYLNAVAGITGMPASDMDWDGNGTATRTEILQGWHAVSVKHAGEGRRACSAYYWRATGVAIRVDCRTQFDAVLKVE